MSCIVEPMLGCCAACWCVCVCVLAAVQVQQHLDRMQQQKEQMAMDKLRQLMPQLGDVARALALSKNEWDIDKAVSMLRSFQVAHLDKINALNKVCCSLCVWHRAAVASQAAGPMDK